MTSRNVDAAAGSDPNGFHATAPGQERTDLGTNGHKPGVLVGNDAAPEFHAETLPAGTAPPSKTFQPQNDNERVGPNAPADAKQPAAHDFPGSTSGDVHAGLGKPIQGQTSAELHHDGQAHNKNPGSGGVEGRGARASGNTVDPHLPENANQRALDNDEASKAMPRGNVGGPPAEERFPSSA